MDFDDPTDQLLAIAGIPGVGAIEFSSRSPLQNFCDPFACTKADDFPNSPFSTMYESYVTIGATTFVESETDYTDGFAESDGALAVIVGDAWEETDGRWFDTDPSTAFTGGSIVSAQFTFEDGAAFKLSGVAVWRGTDGIEMNSVFQASATPTPWSLALFALAALTGRRRRTGSRS